MALVTIGSTVLGLALLGLAAFDIWATVLHTGLESPLSNRFHRAGWRLISGVARHVPFGAQLRDTSPSARSCARRPCRCWSRD